MFTYLQKGHPQLFISLNCYLASLTPACFWYMSQVHRLGHNKRLIVELYVQQLSTSGSVTTNWLTMFCNNWKRTTLTDWGCLLSDENGPKNAFWLITTRINPIISSCSSQSVFSVCVYPVALVTPFEKKKNVAGGWTDQNSALEQGASVNCATHNPVWVPDWSYRIFVVLAKHDTAVVISRLVNNWCLPERSAVASVLELTSSKKIRQSKYFTRCHWLIVTR